RGAIHAGGDCHRPLHVPARCLGSGAILGRRSTPPRRGVVSSTLSAARLPDGRLLAGRVRGWIRGGQADDEALTCFCTHQQERLSCSDPEISSDMKPQVSTIFALTAGTVSAKDTVMVYGWRALAGLVIGYAMDRFDLLILGFMLAAISANLALTSTQASSQAHPGICGGIVYGNEGTNQRQGLLRLVDRSGGRDRAIGARCPDPDLYLWGIPQVVQSRV